jgi:SNF2 family DNA or RNA helicase
VHITRLICKNSIEEQMLTLANRKLELEKDVTARNDDSHGEGIKDFKIIGLIKFKIQMQNSHPKNLWKNC